MAQFDVHRLAGGTQLVVDCQADLLDQLASRFVIPLVPKETAPQPAQRLNPVFGIAGERYVLLTQAAAAVRRSELGEVIASLEGERLAIIGALDVLVSGV